MSSQFDPEDLELELHSRNHDGAGREHLLDVQPAKLRRDEVLDLKYSAHRVSRKDLDETNGHPGDAFSSSSTSDDERETKLERRAGSPTHSDPHRHRIPRKAKSSFARWYVLGPQYDHCLVTRHQELYNALLEARIRLQKAITVTHDIPIPDIPLRSASVLDNTIGVATSLCETLSAMEAVGINFLSFEPSKAGPVSDNPVRSSNLDRTVTSVAAVETDRHPDDLSTVTKWGNRVEASSRHSFGAREPGSLSSFLHEQEIHQATPRTLPDHMDSSDTNPGFDLHDSGFYRQILQGFIKTDRAVNSTKARRDKKHKDPTRDTRASKGRKVRYQTHERLVHFMVPSVPSNQSWHEQQIDELFLSLSKY
ncbi:hypothetical protein NLI96_g1963 [Meripilus lineatus]|uniref:Protein BFR2 n=1 Tax=Meripilus lineatus TaxID=2056292 RepID=A0AAD5VB22_9APHY|nr:hypothetical protein NLI96_g1963 [Physisporinus lineatus]